MGLIDYEQVTQTIVYINLPTPEEPTPEMTGEELLHGFLGDAYRTAGAEVRSVLKVLCNKWNIRFRNTQK